MKRFLAILLSVMVLAMTLMSLFVSASAETVIDDTNDDWIHCVGSKYYDMYGNEVRLTGANWFGFNCSERVLHGLWQVDLRKTLKSIADHGINLLRIPVSSEILYEWKTGNAKSVNIQVNPWGDVNGELEGMNSMQIFDRMVEICKEYGIKIMVDVHSPDANNSGHNYEVWYGKEFADGTMCTTEMWIDTWVWLVDKFKNDDTIIACDLKNEPHGKPNAFGAKWDGSTDENNWKYAAERCANAILDVNPNLLIMIEGIEIYPKEGYTFSATSDSSYHYAWWGGSLRGVRDYPVTVKPQYQSQIVYSPHDYGPKVFKQPWFDKDFTKQTLMDDYWYDTWAYIAEEDIAPLLIGEWGGFMDGDKNEKWMQIMADYIVEKDLSHTFWCINANSGDTGGLLDNSWTAWEEDKYALFEPTLWQSEEGKFIGLDHKVALGVNGITINDYYKNSGEIEKPPVTNTDTETDTEVVTDTEVNTDTDTNVGTDTDSSVGSDTDTATDSDITSDSDSDISGDTDSGTETDTEVNTDIDTDDRFIYGDVNKDKVLDILDVVLTRAHIIGSRDLDTIDSEATKRADMNIDDTVDIIDIVLMRKIIIEAK